MNEDKQILLDYMKEQLSSDEEKLELKEEEKKVVEDDVAKLNKDFNYLVKEV